MTILIDNPGFHVDNDPITAGNMRFRSLEGKLRLEILDEQESEEPSTRIRWGFSGWQPRRFILSGRIVEPEYMGKFRYATYKRLKKASRETEMTPQGPIPKQHILIGDAVDAEGLDSPVLIDCVNMDDTVEDDSLRFSMEFLEYNPEILELTSAPTPSPDRRLPDEIDDPALSLSQGERDLLRQLGISPFGTPLES